MALWFHFNSDMLHYDCSSEEKQKEVFNIGISTIITVLILRQISISANKQEWVQQ